jgi:hypothetical protein
VFTILGLKYAALVFVAAVGVIQAAAAYNNLRGLSFFRQGIFNYLFATVTIGVPLGFFFVWNYLFPINCIAGSQQAGLFFLSTIGAIIFTVIVSSLVNIKFHSPNAAQLKGLEALREGMYFRILWERISGKH